MTRWFLHVDLDEFLAAVEVRRHPELRGRPVVVGGNGDPTQPRQVVATASYEARAYGVHSGMPLRTAARRCPDAVFLPSDKPTYEDASDEVMDVLRRFPVVVEVWGWDEAAVGTDTHDPEALAIELQRAVFAETGLHCSIGIGDNKLRAKTATAFAKPAGRYRLTAENWLEVMGDRSTEALWGVGPKTARKLAELEISTVRQLAAADVEHDATALRPDDGPLVRHARPRRRQHERHRRAVGAARTQPPNDVPARPDRPRRDRSRTDQLAERVTADVVALDRWIERVAIIVRFPSFYTPTRVSKLPVPTQDPIVVARAAIGLLDRLDLRRPVRLLGVRAELTPVAVAVA